MSTITTQGKTFTIQDTPASLDEAIKTADIDGHFKATVVIDQYDFISQAHHGVDDFYDYLVEQILSDAPSVSANFSILGSVDDKLIVEVSNSVLDLLADGWEDHYENVETDTLVAAIDRWQSFPEVNLSGAQAELDRRTAE